MIICSDKNSLEYCLIQVGITDIDFEIVRAPGTPSIAIPLCVNTPPVKFLPCLAPIIFLEKRPGGRSQVDQHAFKLKEKRKSIKKISPILEGEGVFPI